MTTHIEFVGIRFELVWIPYNSDQYDISGIYVIDKAENRVSENLTDIPEVFNAETEKLFWDKAYASINDHE